MDIPLKKYYLQTMELDLNQYVRTTTNKVLTPLLKENNCGDLKPQQQSWLFNLEKATPDKNEWSRLMSWTDGLQGSHTTIPIHGKLKLQENTIYLQLYMKFQKLKTITKTDIDNDYKNQEKGNEIYEALEQEEHRKNEY